MEVGLPEGIFAILQKYTLNERHPRNPLVWPEWNSVRKIKAPRNSFSGLSIWKTFSHCKAATNC